MSVVHRTGYRPTVTTAGERAEAIRRQIANQSGLRLEEVPEQVAAQASLLLSEDAEHLETDRGRVRAHGTWQVLALGRSRALLLTVHPGPAPERGVVGHTAGPVSVEAHVWSRRRLRGLRMSTVARQQRPGDNDVYIPIIEEMRDGHFTMYAPQAPTLPDRAWLELTYDGRAETLVLPMGSAQLSPELLHSLLDDLQ